MAHARLGPSNHRWPYCPGSVREEARFPDIPGEAAIDGTGSHLLLELCLQNGVLAIQYDQQIIGANHPEHPSGWLVGLDRIERVQMCLDYISRRVTELQQQSPGCHVTVSSESTADPGGYFGRDDWWGTVDITLIARQPMTGEVYFIEVIDYKDGRGWVHVKDNTQLLAYLGGKMRPYVGSGPDLVRPFKVHEVPHCRMTIVQPKTSPVIRYVCSTRPDDNFSTDYVMNKLSDLSFAALATDKPDAPLIPGKHCEWCKANPKRGGDCMAEVNKSINVVTIMSDNTEIIASDNGGKSIFEFIGSSFSKIKELTDTQLADLADARDGVMSGFDQVMEEIQARIDQGKHVPGYAMLPGNNSNVWNDTEENIAKMLKARRLKKEEIYPAKLISPAQVLKLPTLTPEQKAKIEKDYIATKSGKLTLKKVSRAVEQSGTDDVKSVQMMFGNLVKPPLHELVGFNTEAGKRTVSFVTEPPKPVSFF